MSTVKTKVCGLRDRTNVLEVSALGPDYIGFIFYRRSSRYAGNEDLSFINELSGVKKVAVFVDAEYSEIDQLLSTYRFDAVQLHGIEDPEFCKTIRSKQVEVIKAFGVDTGFDFNRVKSYTGVVDYFLFDTKTELYGGSGQQFDWQVLKNYKEETPYFISGGIDQELFQSAKGIDDHRLYGIDINSRFELSPGIKNVPMLKTVLK